MYSDIVFGPDGRAPACQANLDKNHCVCQCALGLLGRCAALCHGPKPSPRALIGRLGQSLHSSKSCPVIPVLHLAMRYRCRNVVTLSCRRDRSCTAWSTVAQGPGLMSVRHRPAVYVGSRYLRSLATCAAHLQGFSPARPPPSTDVVPSWKNRVPFVPFNGSRMPSGWLPTYQCSAPAGNTAAAVDNQCIPRSRRLQYCVLVRMVVRLLIHT